MAASDASRIWVKQNGLHRDLSLLVLTLAFTSVFSSPRVCASSDEGLEHVPTLKEIYGAVPRNSFPIVRREVRMPQPTRDSSSQRAQSDIPESLRRGLRRKPDALTVPATDINVHQGTFFAQLQIGTPPQSLLLQIDTGSSDFWAQSKQCIKCFTEILPTYDPTISSTLEREIVNGSYVPWTGSYGDGSVVAIGYKARETLTIGSGDGHQVVIPEFEFGVALNNTGFLALSGIMGLIPAPQLGGASPFLAQLRTLSNGKFKKFSKQFRYCFPNEAAEYSTTSFLSFGEIDESETDSLFSSTKHLHKSKTLWTPIVPNPVNAFYALNMTAITVAGTRISIDPQELTLESVQLNQIMTIIDSGTTLTKLREPYFSKFAEAYLYGISTLTPLKPLSIDANGIWYFNFTRDVFDAYLFPTVSIIFQKWQSKHAHGERQEEIEVFLPKDNVLLRLSDNLYQFSIQNATASMNVIGSVAQQNFLVEYDLEKSRVGFLRASCTFDY